MTAFVEEIAHVLRVSLVLQIIQQNKYRSVTRALEIGEAPVIDDASSGTGNLLASDRVFAGTPHDITKIGRCEMSMKSCTKISCRNH